ncbi:hypothetical protein [Saliphagus sp. LR7]|uniref:hypothetical protein n=1 Tax=Saliphagus sp. LR7 TaxID=2282654 RepID=UPI000DF78319|nr:hypothetical protein [Saliphagus sp. LR7]
MSDSPSNDSLDPRGESRPDSSGQYVYGYDTRDSPEAGGNRHPTQWTSRTTPEGTELVETEVHKPPQSIQQDYNEYYLEFAFVQAALKIFEDEVVEPGWNVEATIDGDRDDEMTEALELWGKNCAIHGGETGQDIRKIINQLPSKRRTKPGAFLEKVGTRDDPDALAAVMMLDPATMQIYTHEYQNLIVQPDDPVHSSHPRTEDGEPAAYIQYPGLEEPGKPDESDPEDFDSIRFAADDIVKITYDPPEDSPWGRTLWPAMKYHIDALKQKLRDQNASIALAGHPHRIYIGKEWDQEDAEALAEAGEKGDTASRSGRSDGDTESQAGRVDYLPGQMGDLQIEVVEGQVTDIDDAVMYDIEAIFSLLPVSKLKIAFEEGINQFVAEPQMAKDDRYVDGEQLHIEEKIEPLFAEKADKLSGGTSYEGEVSWKLEQPKADNPFERSDFDSEAVSTFIGALANYAQSGADTMFGSKLPLKLADMDPEEFIDEADEDTVPAIDEADEGMQEAIEAREQAETGTEGD